MSYTTLSLVKCDFISKTNHFKKDNFIEIDTAKKPQNGNLILAECKKRKFIAKYKNNNRKKYLVLENEIDAIELDEQTKIIGVINTTYIALKKAA